MKLLTALACLVLPMPAIAVMELDKWRGKRADKAAFADIKKQERFVDILGRVCGVR